jgi:hypothetical protein
MDIKHNERNELLKVIFQGSSKQGANPMTIKEKASGKGMCPKGFNLESHTFNLHLMTHFRIKSTNKEGK